MKREISLLGTAALCAMLIVPSAAHADDLKLKDGSTISGTIVGYEESSFKVKTSYGFAVVQKDQVVSISISTGAHASVEKSVEPAAEKSAPAPKPKSESAKATAPPLPAMAGSQPEADRQDFTGRKGCAASACSNESRRAAPCRQPRRLSPKQRRRARRARFRRQPSHLRRNRFAKP